MRNTRQLASCSSVSRVSTSMVSADAGNFFLISLMSKTALISGCTRQQAHLRTCVLLGAPRGHATLRRRFLAVHVVAVRARGRDGVGRFEDHVHVLRLAGLVGR